jgi:Pyruvate/2-oxoacid:ferredoxin oxidoreductase delta subunit
MPLDARTLAYDHDEEALGLPAQPRVVPPARRLAHRIAAGALTLGALALVVYLSGFELGGPWSALGATLGLLVLGALAWFCAEFQGTPAGIRHDDTFLRGVQNRGLAGWAFGLALTAFYVVLYFYDDWKGHGLPPVLDRPTRLLDPLAALLSGKPADRWFLYGVLYTLAVWVFGARMFWKYRHNRYQQVRTASVMCFQLGFALVLPNVLKGLNQPEYYLTYFWPLKSWYGEPDGVHFHWTSGSLGMALIAFGALMTLVATPLLTWRFGKRWYCSFVCGCGGLAETLGDPWRQQSSKTRAAWRLERWMIHAVLVFVTLSTALLWFNSWRRGEFLGQWSNAFSKSYGFLIGSIFSGVIGVGFYPLLGSRVWCRFGCPQAAILGLLQRCFSRFRITTNGGQCMSCGNCSTYCEMGIDVRAYAQQGRNIVRAACVGCGVCAAVCPRGVLRLENGPPAERFQGAEDPWRTLVDALRHMEAPDYGAWQGSAEAPASRRTPPAAL